MKLVHVPMVVNLDANDVANAFVVKNQEIIGARVQRIAAMTEALGRKHAADALRNVDLGEAQRAAVIDATWLTWAAQYQPVYLKLVERCISWKVIVPGVVEPAEGDCPACGHAWASHGQFTVTCVSGCTCDAQPDAPPVIVKP